MAEESDGDPSSLRNVKILLYTACRKLPLAIHLDGNFKLLRWLSLISNLEKLYSVKHNDDLILKLDAFLI
jgi:hypothetical protein